jgi:hypothetical protein
MWSGRGVDVLKVGALQSKIRLTYAFDYQDRWVYNTELNPQPCGLCFGTGKHLKIIRCVFCEGRGHSPNKDSKVDRMRRAAEIGFKKGTAAGVKKRDVIDADWVEVKYEFPEPETHNVNCTDCCAHPCICGKVDDE